MLRDVIELEEAFKVFGLGEEYLPMASDSAKLWLCLFIHLHGWFIRDLIGRDWNLDIHFVFGCL